MKNMHIYCLNFSIPSILSHSCSFGPSSIWIASSTPSPEAPPRECRDCYREEKNVHIQRHRMRGCPGQNQTSQGLSSRVGPALLTPNPAPCPGHSAGLEMMQWCRRGSGARVMLGERTWRTGGKSYKHEWFQDLKRLHETRPLRMRIIKKEKEYLRRSRKKELTYRKIEKDRKRK